MYQLYEIKTQNEGFDWHLYADSYDDASEIIRSFNNFITQKCRNFAGTIHHSHNSGRKAEIEVFFAIFSRPFIKMQGTHGGYALDYRQCSVRTKVQMPYCIMLDYLDKIRNQDFFHLCEIKPLFAGDNRIMLPGHNVPIEVTFGMDKRYEYGNETLLAAAESRLGFRTKYKAENACEDIDVFTSAFGHATQFCQFLNYLPFIKIYSIVSS